MKVASPTCALWTQQVGWARERRVAQAKARHPTFCRRPSPPITWRPNTQQPGRRDMRLALSMALSRMRMQRFAEALPGQKHPESHRKERAITKHTPIKPSEGSKRQSPPPRRRS